MADISVTNTSADLSGKTLVTTEGSRTVTGLLTYDRDPSAPFAVSASSAVVPNLDSDKVDGYEASAFAKLGAANVFTKATTFTPVAVTGGNNTDVGDATVVYVETSAPTGIAGGVAGRVLILINNTGADITLAEESASSVAANRFQAVTGASIIWHNGSPLFIVYNGAASRWAVFANV